jgi:uncharacterized protein (DUF2267 family)
MYETRKDFLLAVMRQAGIETIEEADRITRVIIGLIKARVGHDVSELVAESVPVDLAEGWRAIVLPQDAMERQEMLCEGALEIEEVDREKAAVL